MSIDDMVNLMHFRQWRKFWVRINCNFSYIHPFNNGIPQGSPLAVVLFVIAFEQFNKIILKYSNIGPSVYADDAIIFTKERNLTKVNNTFKNIITDINTWGELSGANLSIDKCKILHICKRLNCAYPTLTINNFNIENVNFLKILGITFDKKFTFKQHCLDLRKNLAARLNILKYLSSKHSLIHTNTLVNITRALILSKIDYGLAVYGWTANTNIKLLDAPYHTAVRRSINAFPTSPVKCVLAEAGLPTIKERVIEATWLLIPKLLSTTNHTLHNDYISAFRHKRTYRLKSTIRRCISYGLRIGLTPPRSCTKLNRQPSWFIHKSNFNTVLHAFNKSTTTNSTYQQLFAEQERNYRSNNWNILYTDGSKTSSNTTFAVVNQQGLLISGGQLPEHCSVFTAEAMAIYKGVEFAQHNRGKYLICTDSMSSIKALQNIYINGKLIEKIRDLCIRNTNKIKIMWVPGHKGIRGNEIADETARLMPSTSPLFPVYSENDLHRHIKKHIDSIKLAEWKTFKHRYTAFNSVRKPALYPSNINRYLASQYARLRIGHTKLTHQHLLTGSIQQQCPFCGNNPSADHILNDCRTLESIRKKHFGSNKPSALLATISVTNITALNNFLKDCKLNTMI